MCMERRIPLQSGVSLAVLFGNLDENILVLQEAMDVEVLAVGNDILIRGDEDRSLQAAKVLARLQGKLQRGEEVDLAVLDYLIHKAMEKDFEKIEHLEEEVVVATFKGKLIKPKTLGQQEYIRAIDQHTLTFGVGPAGTGKTYLAVAAAARSFRRKEVSRIIITRPAIEAGEKLGFLPGDLQEKVDPYLRPLYDALYEIFGMDSCLRMRERGIIEVAPLAYMRGRTLDEAFIILDEAQNTTKDQMKMFLSRFGYESKVIVNGDITQIDLPAGKQSGLTHAVEILKGIDDIAIVNFQLEDVVRHSLVKKILARYEKDHS